MKIKLITLALLLMSTASFAQTLEQTFRNLIAEFKANPYAYVQANYAPDLRFIAGHNGEFRTIDRMVAPNTNVEDIQATDLKFFESGDLAVVTGINTTRYANPNGQPSTYKDAFTYTFQKMNGKWKHVAMQHTKLDYDVPGQQQADEATVKAVCIAQHDAWMQRDVAGLMAVNAPVSYASRYWATKDGYTGSVNGSEEVAKAYKDAIDKSPQPRKATIERSNWQLKPLGENFFWSTFDFISTGPDGKVNRQKEARLLEKIGGQWKLVSVITLPLP